MNIPSIIKGSFGSLEELYARGQEITGLATHYTLFDKLTSGLQPSDLIIIAARPSMGKTALAMNIAENAAVLDGKVVGVFSLEMSREALLMRMLASHAQVDSKDLRQGFLTKDLAICVFNRWDVKEKEHWLVTEEFMDKIDVNF